MSRARDFVSPVPAAHEAPSRYCTPQPVWGLQSCAAKRSACGSATGRFWVASHETDEDLATVGVRHLEINPAAKLGVPAAPQLQMLLENQGRPFVVQDPLSPGLRIVHGGFRFTRSINERATSLFEPSFQRQTTAINLALLRVL